MLPAETSEALIGLEYQSSIDIRSFGSPYSSGFGLFRVEPQLPTEAKALLGARRDRFDGSLHLDPS